jgi:hypothetical protein
VVAAPPSPGPRDADAGAGPWQDREGWDDPSEQDRHPAEQDRRLAEEDGDDDGWDDEGWDYETQAAFGRSWRGEEPPDERFLPAEVIEDAVLVGALHDRGIAMLVTADAVLLPTGRLRAGRLRRQETSASGAPEASRPWPLALWRRLAGRRGTSADRDVSTGEDELFSGVPVRLENLRQPPDLPLTARPPGRIRVVGALMLLAGFVGYPVLVWLLRPNPVEAALMTAAFARLARAGAARLLNHLRLSHHQFEIAGTWRIHSVPWDRLHGVRRGGEMLSVAWQPDIVIDVGPFAAPGGESGRRDRAEQLGAAMLLQRRRALLGGLPGREISSRPSLTWLVLAGAAVVALLSLWRW